MDAVGSGSWDDVEDVLAAALEVSPAARPGFLDERCAGRPELRAEVESLIAAHERSDRFLDLSTRTGAASPDPERLRDDRGRTVGQFRLIEKIGEGGMAVVYRAERVDGEFVQRVAVKLIDQPLRHADALRRFRAERQILATLNHPNIVTLLDAGVTGGGQAYLAMELVDGVPVTVHCADRRLPLEDRLRLFRDVCGAVQDAHQHGVVHRDLKPANILVTADGVPKILDFGVAKLTEAAGPESEPTLTSAFRPLTPNYASPEQVRGLPVTTVSDIYALGVLLYELLTGVRPYETAGKTIDELLHIVGDEEPPRPSVRPGSASSLPYDPRRLHGDLDAIVRKAMSKDPARRYASARELAEDVTRHLTGMPVLAREPSFRYLAVKLARRHRAAFLSAAVALLALVAALAVSLWQTRVATRERNRAQLEAEKAAQVAGFLRNLFASGAPTFTGGRRATVDDILEAGVARVEKELAGQPGVQAAMLTNLGLVYSEWGLSARAVPLLERSLALREALPGSDAGEVAESLWALGKSKVRANDYAAAQRHLERAQRIREQVLGPDHPLLAEVLGELGNVHFYTGRYAQGRAALERAVAIEEKAGGRRLAFWLSNLSNLEMALDDQESARKHLEAAIARAIKDDGRLTSRASAPLLNLAAILRQREDFQRAGQLFEQALVLAEEAYGPDYHGALYTRGELGNLHLAMGDHDRARQYLARAIRGLEAKLGRDNQMLAEPLTCYGRLLLAEGKPREALLHLERALRIREKAFGPRHAETATNLVEIALARARLEGSHAAEPTLRNALAMQREVLIAGHRGLVPTLSALGEMLLDRPDPGEALVLLTEAVEIAQAKLPERHSERLKAEAALARLRASRGSAQPQPPPELPSGRAGS